MKLISKYFFIVIFFASCGHDHAQKTIEKQLPGDTAIKVITATGPLKDTIVQTAKKEAGLKNFRKDDIAKYAISAIMAQPPQIMSVMRMGDIYYVSYPSMANGQLFKYKIMFEGADKVNWGTAVGRWRNTSYDKKVTFEENGNRLKITQTFADGNVIEKEFEIQE